MESALDARRRTGSGSRNKTYFLKQDDVEKRWILLDAENLILGRLAQYISNRLRGKHRPDYTPHIDCGDNVIVVNAAKIVLTGKKRIQKLYHKHTGYVGGLKTQVPEEVLRGKFPERVLLHAVRGMIPKNRLGRRQLGNLRIYPGPEHPHAAQCPTRIDFAAANDKNTRMRAAMAKMTEDITEKIRTKVRSDIDAATKREADRLENAFSKEISKVTDEIGSLTRSFSVFSERAEQQLDVQQRELAELQKFNKNAEAQWTEQREEWANQRREMTEFRETLRNLVTKLEPK